MKTKIIKGAVLALLFIIILVLSVKMIKVKDSTTTIISENSRLLNNIRLIDYKEGVTTSEIEKYYSKLLIYEDDVDYEYDLMYLTSLERAFELKSKKEVLEEVSEFQISSDEYLKSYTIKCEYVIDNKAFSNITNFLKNLTASERLVSIKDFAYSETKENTTLSITYNFYYYVK